MNAVADVVKQDTGLASPAATANGRKKILVIDDEQGPRESVRFLFKNQYQVFCESTVDKGVETLSREKPDIVILDIRMPGKTGLEGLKEIRDVDQDVSVVMLTGFGSIETAGEAMRFGANDYIKKPFDTNEMREVVLRHIGRTEVMRAKSRAAREIEVLNRQLRAEIDQKARMADLGMASSELLHDLRSPLTAIYGYVHLLSEDLSKVMHGNASQTAEVMDCLKAIEKSVQRCQEMADVWRDLGHRDPSRMKPVTVRSLLADALEGARPVAEKAGVSLSLAEGPAGLAVLADQPQMYRALQNVLQNAILAAAEGGRTVEASCRQADGGMAEISVADTGKGIPEEALLHMGEPCFTTRRQSGGTGLGLFITRMVVENAHGGAFTIGNRQGAGAVATIRIPLVSG